VLLWELVEEEAITTPPHKTKNKKGKGKDEGG
jgi:hypothetical protein